MNKMADDNGQRGVKRGTNQNRSRKPCTTFLKSTSSKRLFLPSLQKHLQQISGALPEPELRTHSVSHAAHERGSDNLITDTKN